MGTRSGAREFFREYFVENANRTVQWGLTTRNSKGLVFPVRKFWQLFGGKTWSIMFVQMSNKPEDWFVTGEDK